MKEGLTASLLVLRFRAPDKPGIVARISSLVAGHGCDIREAQVYGDHDTGGFFVRMALADLVAPLARELELKRQLDDLNRRLRVLIAVSKFGHCLVVLIHKTEIGKLIDEFGAELTVLARYMLILSDEFSARLAGQCINIHHSFLPSFKGAKLYHQAHTRGLKLIGATAHYVTDDLDEGPIIKLDVRRVSHRFLPLKWS